LVDVNAIEDVILGDANQAGEDNRNVARMALLLAGLPVHIGGITVNRLCASGLQSIMDASRAIQAGDGDLYIAGGVESMSRAPFVMAKADTAFSRVPEIYDTTIGWRFTNKALSALHYPFAAESQIRYQAAHEANRFAEELITVNIPQKKGDPKIFNKDEHPRLSSLEELAKLKPAFKKDGSVTAGNSSGINDGSAMLLLAGEETVKRYNLQPIARIVSKSIAGVDPAIMGIGPVPATQKALQRAGLSVADIGLFELNEAFASQGLACMQELGLNPSIVNVNGGSIAIGHPLGASGSRISTTLIHEMRKRKVKYGVATMCIGVGQGAAIVFEAL
jgi:acetyl-CoA C-acetyltransferase